MTDLDLYGRKAREAGKALALAGGRQKNEALSVFARELIDRSDEILAANDLDIKAGELGGMKASLIDRLRLTPDRIAGISDAVKKLTLEEDPVGRTLMGSTLPNGMRLRRVSVPIGVIAVIYEARPNVTADAACLCLKSGNACILKGGKEAVNSNAAIAGIMRDCIEKAGLPRDCVQLIEDNDRETTAALMALSDYVDLLIPRGGAGLINACRKNASMPVIETGVGNCHVYIDKSADLDMARDIVVNAKTRRVSVCNACESLLVHRDVLAEALGVIGPALREKGVEIRGDEAVRAVLPYAVPATEEDWGTEYLDYIISVKTVDNLDEAIEHIQKYSTRHSESIVTSDYFGAREFTRRVDSAAVYVNVSTAFTDGGEFGFGAEIGISTGRLHVRGPVGLKDLVTFKYVIEGEGQTRK